MRIAKFRALSWPERKVLLSAMLLLPMFWIGLRMFGLSRFQAWLSRSPAVVQSPQASEDLRSIGALVNIAGNQIPFPSTCLSRSLLLNWLLHRRGVQSELRIGVRLTQGEFEAHAWVIREGRPINDAQDIGRRYAAFDEPISHKLFT